MFKKIINLLKTLALGTIGGLLGALGGTDGVSKGVRRIGIPLLITLYALFTLHNWWVLTLLSMIGVFSMGYGIPCFIPGYEDAGSMLGRFFFYKFNKNEVLANIFTRGTVGVACSLTLLSIPILRSNWGIYGLRCLAIISVYSIFSWRNLGTFVFRGKILLWSEFVTYFVITAAAQILIK